MSSTICALPWISASVRNNGDLRVCCQANVGAGGGILRKTNGEPFNWSKDTFEAARNSETSKELRLSMLEGKWHPTCERCRSEEAAGISSRRVRVNQFYENVFSAEKARRGTTASGEIRGEDFPVRDLDVRFGNLCNLRCRMCGPTDSSSWYREHAQLHGPNFLSSNGKIDIVSEKGVWKAPAAGFEWYESDHVREELDRLAPSVRQIYVVGGEPMMIEGHWDYLRLLVRQGHASEILLEYNTNLTRVPEEAWDLWRHFKVVSFGVSLDGVGAVNDYIRYPSRFSVIERNIERLDVAEGNIRVWVAPTISIYNVLHIPDMILWKVSKRFQRVNSDPAKPFLTSHPLHKPEHLSIKALPSWAKDIVLKRYRSFPPLLEEKLAEQGLGSAERSRLIGRAEKLLEGYLKFMFGADLSHLIHRFRWDTLRLDEMRGQNFAELVPEFAALLEKPVTDTSAPTCSHIKS